MACPKCKRYDWEVQKEDDGYNKTDPEIPE